MMAYSFFLSKFLRMGTGVRLKVGFVATDDGHCLVATIALE